MSHRSQEHLLRMGRTASNGESPDFWPGVLQSLLTIGNPGHARIIVMPGPQCDRVRIYKMPTGQPLDKATGFVADQPCTPGVEFQYVDGDPNIINVALSPPSVMERQWSRARFVDDFNRANAALNASPVASVGGSWVHDGAIANAAAVDTNTLKSNTADTVGSAYKTPPLGSADHWVSFKVTALASTTASQINVCCRLADRNNWIGVRVGSDGINVLRKVAGVFGPNIYGPAGPVAVGDTIRLEVQGTTYTLKRNGVVLSTGPIGDAALTSGDTGVVMRNSATATIDEFQAGLVFPPTARYAHAGTNLDNRSMYSSDGINWVSGSVPIDASPQNWNGIAYSPELNLFAAIASGGGTPTTARAMTSPDGITWTVRNMLNTLAYQDICWGGPAGAKLFVAVASGAVAGNILTSPDGINWASRTKPNTNQISAVCWAPALNLFVVVCSTGTGNRVLTSGDGITWTAQVSANDVTWTSICWSPELNLLVAVANTGTGRCMTSPDGINWTLRGAANGVSDLITWKTVCWSAAKSRFVALGNVGSTGLRSMWSADGITWVQEGDIAGQAWTSVIWVAEIGLFVATNSNASTARVATSVDGVTWVNRTNSPANSTWNRVAWSPGLGKLVAVAAANGINLELLTWGGMNLKAGDTVRYSVKVVETNGSIGRVYSNPGRNNSAQAGMVTGAVYMNATAIAADADAFGFYAGTDKLAVLEDIVIYKKTPTTAPQGIWDYYVFPATNIGVEGPMMVSPSIMVT